MKYLNYYYIQNKNEQTDSIGDNSSYSNSKINKRAKTEYITTTDNILSQNKLGHERAESKNSLIVSVDDKKTVIENTIKNCHTEENKKKKENKKNINNYSNNNDDNKKEIVQFSSRRNISGIIGKNFDNINLNSNQNDEIIDNNYLIGNYCSDCYMEIPLRGYHCKICGYCVGTFDHHCVYVFNCIGEKNKCLFHLFIIFHSFLICFCDIYLFFHFDYAEKSKDFFIKNWILIIILLISILLFSFIFSLVTFQFQILIINQTTYENYAWHKINYMTKLSGSQKSPFNLGFINNIKVVYCRKNFLKMKKDDIWNFKDMIDWKFICNIK